MSTILCPLEVLRLELQGTRDRTQGSVSRNSPDSARKPGTVDGYFGKVKATDLVVGGESFLDDDGKDSSCFPFVSPRPQGRVRGRFPDELFGVHPRARCHKTDEHRLEADPV